MGLTQGSSLTPVAGEQALRARPLVRGGVTQRYAAASAPGGLETLRPECGNGPEDKTAAQQEPPHPEQPKQERHGASGRPRSPGGAPLPSERDRKVSLAELVDAPDL